MAAPRLKTQLEIGKEYNDTPWGRKNEYAAMSPYGDSVLRRYTKKYRKPHEGQYFRTSDWRL